MADSPVLAPTLKVGALATPPPLSVPPRLTSPITNPNPAPSYFDTHAPKEEVERAKAAGSPNPLVLPPKLSIATTNNSPALESLEVVQVAQIHRSLSANTNPERKALATNVQLQIALKLESDLKEPKKTALFIEGGQGIDLTRDKLLQTITSTGIDTKQVEKALASGIPKSIAVCPEILKEVMYQHGGASLLLLTNQVEVLHSAASAKTTKMVDDANQKAYAKSPDPSAEDKVNPGSYRLDQFFRRNPEFFKALQLQRLKDVPAIISDFKSRAPGTEKVIVVFGAMDRIDSSMDPKQFSFTRDNSALIKAGITDPNYLNGVDPRNVAHSPIGK